MNNLNIVKPVTKKKKAIGCPVQEQCGGCLGQNETYDHYLTIKQKQIEALAGESCKVEPIIGMADPCHYRKKVHAVFGHEKGGTPICGVKDQTTNKVISVGNCCIDDKKALAIIETVRSLLKSFKIKTFDENSGFGLLRYVSVRNSLYTGEIMVVLVLSSSIMPSKNNFVKALKKIHPDIDTIIINENYKKTKQILGEKETIIYGKGFIKDKLGGKEFRIAAKSYYPVNPVQAERLYEKVISYAGLTGNETVLDAYCGIGTIGILASGHVRKVLSVELNPNAVRDAISNVKRNNIKNIDFYTKDAGELVQQIVEAGTKDIDVIFVDPPKTGCDQPFMDGACQLKPKKIIYLARNLVTLAKDLDYLSKKGYKVKKAIGADVFPWMDRVEVVLLLTRKGDA